MCGLMLSFESQYPHRITTKDILSFLVITSKSLVYGPIICVNAVPFLDILLQRREERVISACSKLVPRLTQVSQNTYRKAGDPHPTHPAPPSDQPPNI
jgi:hypothetical protein